MEQTKEKQSFINTVSKPPKRRCSACGQPYYRVNAVSQWTTRNPGRRFGWHKDIARTCLRCQDISESKKVINLANVNFSDKIVIRKEKSR